MELILFIFYIVSVYCTGKLVYLVSEKNDRNYPPIALTLFMVIIPGVNTVFALILFFIYKDFSLSSEKILKSIFDKGLKDG